MPSKGKSIAREGLRSVMRSERSMKLAPTNVQIAIDMDEVIAEVHEVMIAIYNRAKGTVYTIEDHKDWDFRSVGSNYEEMMGYYVDAWRNHWKEIRLIGDKEKIIELGQYFVLDIVSSRGGDGVTDGTCDGADSWIRMHKLEWMPVFFDSTGIKKHILDYQLYIDDSPRLAEAIVESGRGFVLLASKPYNAHLEENSRLLRVRDIDEAVDEIISAAKDLGMGKRLYQNWVGQRFIRDPASRDAIVAESLRRPG
jgi:5'(3')-deoxyribonucleotidase